MLNKLAHQERKARERTPWVNEKVMLAQFQTQRNACFNQSQKKWTFCKYGDGWCSRPIWNYNDQSESEYIQL